MLNNWKSKEVWISFGNHIIYFGFYLRSHKSYRILQFVALSHPAIRNAVSDGDATFQATQESTTSALPLLDRRSYGVETALVTPTGTKNLLQIRDGIISAGWKGKKTCRTFARKTSW